MKSEDKNYEQGFSTDEYEQGIGDGFYDDYTVMSELIGQFVDSITGKETEEQMNEMVEDAVENIRNNLPTMDR